MNVITNRSSEHDSESTCGICGDFHDYSKCTIITIGQHVPDNVIPPRALLTLPEIVGVEMMADQTYSIVAKSLIKMGTQFGPFEAQKLLTLDPTIIFPLKLFNVDVEDLSEYYLDSCNGHCCNWMMFITPAQTIEEQNLVCFQEKSKILYVVIRDIMVGEFLKVWYAPYYAKKMKKDLLKSQNEYEICEDVHPIDLNNIVKKQQSVLERDSWTCKFCGKLETNVITFAKHMIEHYSKSTKKQCEFCKQSFSTLHALRRHIRSIHKKKARLSKNLKRDSNTSKTNLKDAIVGGPLLNDILNDSFGLDNTNLALPNIELSNFNIISTNPTDNQDNLLEGESLSLTVENLLTENVKELDHFNFEIAESQEQHVCDICLKSFSKLPYLLQHLKTHTGRYTCLHCLKIFCRSENLKSHKCTAYMRSLTHICSFCQKGFTLKKYLKRHVRTIHEKKNACTHCRKNFYSNKDYLGHNCCISTPNNLFHCDTCSKKFSRESYLKKHMRTHLHKERTTETFKRFICEICACQFVSAKGLQLHSKVHSEGSLSCRFCNKKFHRLDVLKNHLLSHEAAKVTCTICNTKLKSKQSLAVHMLTHKGLKPFKCETCSQTFRQRSALVKHSKKHSKICIVCDKQFETEILYQKHEATHELKGIFMCPLCNKIMKLRASIKRHLKQFHPEADLESIMSEIKAKEVTLIKDPPSIATHITTTSAKDNNNLNNDNRHSFEDIVENFENIIQNYDPDDLATKERELSNFNVMQTNMDLNNQTVCLSMPDLSETDQEITLGDNAYMLDNGTIVEPKDQGNVLLYVLDKEFLS